MTRANSTAAITIMLLGVGFVSFLLVALSATVETLFTHVLVALGAGVLLFFFFNLADVVLDA